jgi:hypothetical protein
MRSSARVGRTGGVIRDIGYRQRVFRCPERSGSGYFAEVNYVREKYAGESVGEHLPCPAINRTPTAGQHQGSTSAIRTATNALVAD